MCRYNSNNHVLTVIDEADRKVYERRLPNDPAITKVALEPYRAELVAVAVESTFKTKRSPRSGNTQLSAAELTWTSEYGGAVIRIFSLTRRDRSRAKEQRDPDDASSHEPRGALTRRRKAFNGDGRRHGRHRAQLHDPGDHEDPCQIGTAVAAAEAEPQTVSKGGARLCQQRTLSLIHI